MSVNKVILLGHLGKDPELRHTTSGTAVANVSIATSEKFKDREGQQQERTEWHNLVFWKRLAEVVSEYLSKGSRIYVEGRIQTRKYQDKDGNDRYATEIVVSELTMLGGTQGGGQRSDREGPPPDHGGTDNDEPTFSPDDDIPF